MFKPKPGIDWKVIRARYEGGESSYSIAKTVDVVAASIRSRASRERWAKKAVATAQDIELVLESDESEKWCKDLATRAKFTPEKGAKILTAIKKGATIRMAAAMMGVAERTLKDWAASSPHFTFAIEGARASNAMRLVGYMDNAAAKDWKAAERLLSVNPMTREAFAPRGAANGHGVTVQVNVGVGRPKVEKDAEVVDITPA